jgi:hypothetical protein
MPLSEVALSLTHSGLTSELRTARQIAIDIGFGRDYTVKLLNELRRREVATRYKQRRYSGHCQLPKLWRLKRVVIPTDT